jgi:hypothetical protein
VLSAELVQLADLRHMMLALTSQQSRTALADNRFADVLALVCRQSDSAQNQLLEVDSRCKARLNVLDESVNTLIQRVHLSDKKIEKRSELVPNSPSPASFSDVQWACRESIGHAERQVEKQVLYIPRYFGVALKVSLNNCFASNCIHMADEIMTHLAFTGELCMCL